MTVKNKVAAIFGITLATCGLSTLGFSQPAERSEGVLVLENANEQKLRRIKINVTFQDATIEDAIDLLRQQSVELDTLEKDPAKKGVNFVVKLPRDRAMPTVHQMKLSNIPLGVALEYICEAAEMNYEVTEFAVTITSPPHGEWKKAKK